jgi:hypothetical protein
MLRVYIWFESQTPSLLTSISSNRRMAASSSSSSLCTCVHTIEIKVKDAGSHGKTIMNMVIFAVKCWRTLSSRVASSTLQHKWVSLKTITLLNGKQEQAVYPQAEGQASDVHRVRSFLV